MIEVAKKAALEAGKILAEGFQKENSYSLKEDFSNSTQADKDAEKVIIDIIKESFPDHAILAEESGEQGSSDYKWVIDPLDGTSNFVRGIPIFGVAIALTYKNSIILGVNYLPLENQLFWAEKGKGAFLNDQKIQVSTKEKVKEVIAFFESGRDEESRRKLGEIFRNLLPEIGTFKKLGCSVYSLSQIAKGNAEIMVDVNSRFWDVASSLIIVEEAGGKVTDFSGGPYKMGDGDFLVSNTAAHENFLKLLKT